MGATAGGNHRLERRSRRAPGGEIVAGELVGQRLDRRPGVARQPHRLVVAADLLAVDVDVDVGRVRGIELPGIGAVLVHPRAGQQDDVGAGDQLAIVAGHPATAHDVAGDADRQRMRFVNRALAHAGGHHRDRSRRRARGMNAAAGDDQRPPRRGEEAGGLADLPGIGAGTVEREGAERRQARRPDRRRGGGGDLLEEVHRAEQDDRAGAAAGGRGEGHVDIVGHPRQIVDPADPFGAAGEQRHLVELLEGVAVALGAMHLLHDRDHRDRRLERLRQARHQEGGGGPVLRGDDRHLVGDAGIGVGHRGAGILGAIADLADAELRRDQMQQRGNALAEHHLDAMAAERLEKEVGAAAIGVAMMIAGWTRWPVHRRGNLRPCPPASAAIRRSRAGAAAAPSA